jgi:hypothetical protein
MELNVITMPAWPQLAWLAECRASSDVISVLAGDHVERADDFLCEGVWAGPYADRDIDATDLIFGSGARVRGDEVVFVSAGCTLDRLHALRRGEYMYVSNSLPCLLAVTGGSLDLGHTSYGVAFNSIRRGLRGYKRQLPTSVGPVEMIYFENVVWDGVELHRIDKPNAERDFSSYAKYRMFLDTSMDMLAKNARAVERRYPFELITTLSSGYDSATCAVLARQVGCTEAFGFDRSRHHW